MEQTLVTVVIPVYNTARYLDRCLRSVTGQSWTALDILLIDDGSTDESPALCDVWAAKDPRVRVIHKPNAGLGMARNTGIEAAAGEYICFFDSDDYLDPGTVRACCALARSTGAQTVCFGYHQVGQDGRVRRSFVPHTPRTLYEGEEVQRWLLPELIQNDPSCTPCSQLHLSAWAGMYSMELIRRTGWRFVSEREIISEDYYSLLYLYRHVERAAVLARACYFYCERPGSLTRICRPDRCAQIDVYYERALAACGELGYGPVIRTRLAYTYLGNLLPALKQLLAADGSRAEKRRQAAAALRSPACVRALEALKGEPLPAAWRIFAKAAARGRTGLCCALLRLQNLRETARQRWSAAAHRQRRDRD